MATEIRSAIDFYERHPISADIIVAKLKTACGHLNNVSPEELFPHDQDHYGALAANDALAAPAGIGPNTRVADFCAGLAGPARYLARRYGADVTGIELTPACRGVVGVDRDRGGLERREAVIIVERIEQGQMQNRRLRGSLLEAHGRTGDRIVESLRPAVRPRHHLHAVGPQRVQLAPVGGAPSPPMLTAST